MSGGGLRTRGGTRGATNGGALEELTPFPLDLVKRRPLDSSLSSGMGASDFFKADSMSRSIFASLALVFNEALLSLLAAICLALTSKIFAILIFSSKALVCCSSALRSTRSAPQLPKAPAKSPIFVVIFLNFFLFSLCMSSISLHTRRASSTFVAKRTSKFNAALTMETISTRNDFCSSSLLKPKKSPRKASFRALLIRGAVLSSSSALFSSGF